MLAELRLLRGDVVALAVHADDQALVPQGRQCPGCRPVADLMLLGEGQYRRDAAGESAALDVVSQDRRQLLMQRDG